MPKLERLSNGRVEGTFMRGEVNNIGIKVVDRECYNHPAKMGWLCFQKVLPMEAPKVDYAMLEKVQDGTGAQAVYVNAIDPDVTPERKGELIQRLLTY